ncbi:MAG: glycosyltransferase, partial [Chloroflexia bacterium]
CATPVVATPQAVAALRARPGEHFLLGRTADELADQIVRLIGNPQLAETIGRAGRAYVQQNHQWTTVAAALEEVYRDAVRCTQEGPGTVEQTAIPGELQSDEGVYDA